MLFFFHDTATTEIYTLSLHDALPISRARSSGGARRVFDARKGEFASYAVHERDQLPLGAVLSGPALVVEDDTTTVVDRKSTRLNSSHSSISYAVFCLKKKKKKQQKI